MKLLLVILALAWAGLLICVPARAQTTTERAISAVCPGREYLAGHVDEAARRYLVPRLHLVAVIWVESRCIATAIGALGEIGLMQLLGVARNGLSRRALLDPRTNILTGARWLSLREVDCGGQVSGLSGYNARTCTGGRRYAHKVLAVVKRIRKEIECRR
jgi:soluble lytic murein transglycosylase-like protein